MNRTSIEWVRGPTGEPGLTWNPIVGCSRGCNYCYARRFAKRQRKRCHQCYDFVPHLHPERLRDPARRMKPTGIFVCSMGELFDLAFDARERDTTNRVLWRMSSPQVKHHRFYLLTKNPQRAHIGIASWLCDSGEPHPRNWWIGTSVSTQAEADKRIPELLRLREHGDWPVLFVSIEPILGPLNHSPWLCGVDWVIVGAQTGPGAVRPERAWVQSAVDQCASAGVPCFVKNNARRLHPRADWPQEMPGGGAGDQCDLARAREH